MVQKGKVKVSETNYLPVPSSQPDGEAAEPAEVKVLWGSIIFSPHNFDSVTYHSLANLIPESHYWVPL